jgi:hypothetical protein
MGLLPTASRRLNRDAPDATVWMGGAENALPTSQQAQKHKGVATTSYLESS